MLTSPLISRGIEFYGFEVGYLLGLTPASGRSAIRWKLEYEIVF